MAERRPPGWYQDPDDPAQLSHWGGRGWSGRHRSLPAWMLSDAEVVLEPSWGSLQKTPGGPLLEGPVRPTPLPAVTRRALAEHREGSETQRLVRPSGTGERSTGAGAVGGGSTFAPAPWTPARRPLMVFCALVGVAVLMMAATVMGVGRGPGVESSAVGRDAAFMARATSVCQAGLIPVRTSPTGVLQPAGNSARVASAEQSADAVSALEQQLRGLPVAADASAAVGDWLDDLGRFVTDERQLALDLATASVPKGPGTGAGPTAAQQAAIRVSGDINRADAFTGSNSLSACSLAPAKSSTLVPIP